jgi:hypothetical protein
MYRHDVHRQYDRSLRIFARSTTLAAHCKLRMCIVMLLLSVSASLPFSLKALIRACIFQPTGFMIVLHI